MKHRFLLHSLSHTIVVVDISEIGLPREIYPQDGQRQRVSTIRFRNWTDAERYLQRLGADAEALERICAQLEKTSVAVLTIV